MKTILITGSSSGIGQACAQLFQSREWNVVATMRSPEKDTVLQRLDNVLVERLDVTDGGSIRAAVEAGIAHFGSIDVLLNNAGFGAYGPLEATPIETFRRQFDTNVIGILETTKALLPHFRERRQGTIVNVSSIGGKIAFPLGTLYHGTKFAVEGLSEALSYEMAAIGVRVKVVEPGMVNTDFGGRSFDFNNDDSLLAYQDMVGKLMAGFQALGNTAFEASDVAEVIYQAVIDESDRLRYAAGNDARTILDQRKREDDATFMKGIRQQFKL